ncbi:hypothetical protein FA09DRAFT_329896 [Tilletiopsis washingtonensis]|uniref:MIP18 family-like domain-containing protein n=1 Tax=Tilletiopsis washingtonensis TaxID=58919 RepID=A0A316ZAH0_9BASI|nr:hypothetical protein FA09DRAFT_329896 [Tilletiopsis washingtonensis]PWN98296.1 hypothetical protein FA09DRAFT_329896 [Tilletiopsis washingtonensis]
MADKDNANPIIHTAGAGAPQRSTADKDAHADEWWRDAAVHRAPAAQRSGAEAAPEESGGAADEEEKEAIDSFEVYDLVRSISDPEHPLTLEQLAVVNAQHISVDEGDAAKGRLPTVLLEFTPTIPHCSMATLIGLALRVRLLRALPPRYKVDIRVREGTHQSEKAVNKQLNDKERVAAALENQHLLGVVADCLATAARRGASEEEALRIADARARELGIVA